MMKQDGVPRGFIDALATNDLYRADDLMTEVAIFKKIDLFFVLCVLILKLVDGFAARVK